MVWMRSSGKQLTIGQFYNESSTEQLSSSWRAGGTGGLPFKNRRVHSKGKYATDVTETLGKKGLWLFDTS